MHHATASYEIVTILPEPGPESKGAVEESSLEEEATASVS